MLELVQRLDRLVQQYLFPYLIHFVEVGNRNRNNAYVSQELHHRSYRYRNQGNDHLQVCA
jgi:hypothetical protein